MPTRRKNIIASLIALVFAVVVAAHLRLWWQATSAKYQHMEALGRTIPMSWHNGVAGTITIPATARYQVRTVEPYYYALKLRAGYTISADVRSRDQHTTIGYFIASPRYPWWYIVDVFGLKNAEVISLDEHYAVYAHPRSWLAEQRLEF